MNQIRCRTFLWASLFLTALFISPASRAWALPGWSMYTYTPTGTSAGSLSGSFSYNPDGQSYTVWSGTSYSSLVYVSGSSGVVATTPGTTYYIRVYNDPAKPGPFFSTGVGRRLSCSSFCEPGGEPRIIQCRQRHRMRANVEAGSRSGLSITSFSGVAPVRNVLAPVSLAGARTFRER